jgi:hypothetical protein
MGQKPIEGSNPSLSANRYGMILGDDTAARPVGSVGMKREGDVGVRADGPAATRRDEERSD